LFHLGRQHPPSCVRPYILRNIFFQAHTCIYFNFQFHKDILVAYFQILLHCSPVHSKTAVLKGPILFLSISTSRILSSPQRCPHMQLYFPHTALLIYCDNGKSTVSRNVGKLLPDHTASHPKRQQSTLT